MNWKKDFEAILPLLGQHNWILVVDKAYPMQVAPGFETFYTGEKMVSVLKHVLACIQDEKHVRPIVYTEKELLFVREDLSKGADSLKSSVTQALTKQRIEVLPQTEIDAMIQEASKQYQVLVLKTDCAVPYSSVCIELDTAYWSEERERILRERIS